MIQLKYPLIYKEITIENNNTKEIEKKITELNFHPIKTKNLREISGDIFDASGNLTPAGIPSMIKMCCRIPQVAADEVDMRDIDEVMEGIAPFLPKSRQTGKK